MDEMIATTNESLDENNSRSSETVTSAVVPQIGNIFYVRRLDNEWCRAEILETRLIENHTEYFVHFENC